MAQKNLVAVAALARRADVTRNCARRFLSGKLGQTTKDRALSEAYKALGGADVIPTKDPADNSRPLTP